MIEVVLRNAARFVILIFLQALVLNNIQLGGYINPYLYVLFILLLPVETPGWFLLVLAFFLGLWIDMFANTMGMHAAACVLMAFCRPYMLRIIAPREGYEQGDVPLLHNFGIRWFLTYAGVLVFLHHLLLFYIEVFRMSEFFSTLLRVMMSAVLTLVLIVVSQYLFYNVRSEK